MTDNLLFLLKIFFIVCNKNMMKRNGLFFLLIISTTQIHFNFKKVISGVLIPKDKVFVYNEESIINVGDYKVFIDKIEIYNKNKELVEASISKPEGSLSYTKATLEKDMLLTKYSSFQLDRKEMKIGVTTIIDANKNYSIKYKSKDTLFSVNKDKVLILIK